MLIYETENDIIKIDKKTIFFKKNLKISHKKTDTKGLGGVRLVSVWGGLLSPTALFIL